MRAFAITGIVTASWISPILSASAMRATPPSRRMSAGTRSSAITAHAPASSAIRAWSAVVTSMIPPPLSISARPVLTLSVPTSIGLDSSWLPGAPAPAGDEQPVAVPVAARYAADPGRARKCALVPALPVGQRDVARVLRVRVVEDAAGARDLAFPARAEREAVPVDPRSVRRHAARLELRGVVGAGDRAQQRRRRAGDVQALDVPGRRAESRQPDGSGGHGCSN